MSTQSKSRLLKLHDAIFDLNKVIHIEVIKIGMRFYFDGGQSTYYEFATEKDALFILDKCYEIMKG